MLSKLKKYLSSILYLTIALNIFIPTFGAIDMIGPIYLYFSIVQVVIGAYIFFSLDKEKMKLLNFHLTLKLYSGFLFLSVVSIFISINKVESLVELQKYFSVFFCFVNLYLLSFQIKNPIRLFTSTIVILLFLESGYVFLQFANEYRILEGLIGRSNNIKGFSSNLNVAAFSILIKIPILFYSIIRVRSFLYKCFSYFIIFISIFSLFVLSSRGAILGLALFVLSSFFFVFLIKRVDRKSYIINFIILFLVTITSLQSQTKLYNRSDSFQTINRVSNFSDSSTNDRKGYYKDAIKHILSYPVLGSGAGTWRIISIKYDSNTIEGYQVPYQVHNDFLQVGAESGVFAMIFFIGFFIAIIFTLFKFTLQGKSYFEKALFYFLMVSVLIYCLDSSINFPKSRPLNQMNLIYFISIILFIFNKKDNSNSLNISTKKYLFFTVVISPFLIYGSYRLFNQTIENTTYYVENNFTQKYSPLKVVENFEENYPSLGYASVSNKVAKARYFIREKKYDQAIKLLHEGIEDNPYLMNGEIQLARIYLEQNKLDSAYIYAKKAFYGLPNNRAHASLYQKVLFKQNNLTEFATVIDMYKGDNELVLQNHAYYLSKKRLIELEVFKINKKDSLFFEKSIKLYPNNDVIQKSFKLYLYPINVIKNAKRFDSIANKYFNEGELNKAINNWESALNIIPNDDSYYLNIAQAFTKQKKHKKAIEYLKKIDDNELDNSQGKKDMYFGLNYISLNNKLMACKYLSQAALYNYPNARNLYDAICR